MNNAENEKYLELKSAFDRYWQSTLLPFLKQKEDIRLKYVRHFWGLTLGAVIISPLLMYGIYVLSAGVGNKDLFGLVYIVLAIAIYIIRGPYSKYRKDVKQDVMNVFIRFFDHFQYLPGKGLSQAEIEQSRLFPHYDYVSADDCFCGRYEGVGIRICEQELEKIIHTQKGGTRRVTVFRGIAVELDMNKNFNGQTIAVKSRGLLNVFQKFQGMEKVKLEDVIFEKNFEVFSSDQVEARYLLTTSFMERLLKLQKLFGGRKISAGFREHKIMIAIDTGRDMFEPCSFFKTNINKLKIDNVFEEFWTIFSIIHILKLNQKTGL